MTLSQLVVGLIFLVAMAPVFAGILRPDLAALSIAALLGIGQLAGLGLIGPAGAPGEAVRAFNGFSQPAIITLIGLFVLTRGLDRTGITRWIAGRITHLGGRSEARLVLLFSSATALLSLFMNNVAAGALLLTGALETSRQTGIKPGKLLIPVAFGSLLGGMATYFTTANIVISDLLRLANPPQTTLTLLDFLPAGGLVAAAGILYLVVFGRKLLPAREDSRQGLLRGLTGQQMEEYYQLGERLWELRLEPESPLVGKTLAGAALGERFGLAIPLIWRERGSIFSPQAAETLRSGDILLLVGREERIRALEETGMGASRAADHRPLAVRGVAMVELIVAPHSEVDGRTLKQISFRQATGFTALALRRGERNFRTDVGQIPLALGDTLLVVGSPARMKQLRAFAGFFLLEPNPAGQPVDSRRAATAVAITALAIGASIAGAPTSLAVLVGALALVLSGVISMEDAYQAVEWPVLFQVAGMVALSQAMVQTGLSSLIGNGMIAVSAPFGPLGLAAGGFLLAALLTQVMGGQVTGLVVGPVVISAAIGMGIHPQAAAVATAIGCSASFLTPMAHPVNLLMMAPGNYRFNDFFKVGWPLMVICFLVLLVGMKMFWGL